MSQLTGNTPGECKEDLSKSEVIDRPEEDSPNNRRTDFNRAGRLTAKNAKANVSSRRNWDFLANYRTIFVVLVLMSLPIFLIQRIALGWTGQPSLKILKSEAPQTVMHTHDGVKLSSSQTIIHDIRTPFDWYVPQGYPNGYPLTITNYYYHSAPNDCGPASVAMILRYLSQTALKPRPDEVRAQVPSLRDKRWNTSGNQLVAMLNSYGISGIERYQSNDDVGTIIRESIQNDQPLIISFLAGKISTGSSLQVIPAILGGSAPTCPASKQCTVRDGIMYAYDNSQATDYNVGRYYDYKGSHWAVVKGLGQINGEDYAIMYDPSGWVSNGKYWYAGQGPGEDIVFMKGFDRWYKLSELITATRAAGVNTILKMPRASVTKLQKQELSQQARVTDNQSHVEDIESIKFLSDITVPAGTILTSGQLASKKWLIQNTGQTGLCRNIILCKLQARQSMSWLILKFLNCQWEALPYCKCCLHPR